MGKRQGGLAKKLCFPSSFVFPPEQGRRTPACVYGSLWTVEAPRGIGLSAALLLLCFFLSHCTCTVCVCACVCVCSGWGITVHVCGVNVHVCVVCGGGRRGVGINSNHYIQKAAFFKRRWSLDKRVTFLLIPVIFQQLQLLRN